MITVYAKARDIYVAELVRFGFIRAFTRAQVRAVKTDSGYVESLVYVFINPGDAETELLNQLLCQKVKIILLGVVSPAIARLLNVETATLTNDVISWGACNPAPVYGFAESEARIHYSGLPEGIDCAIVDRPLIRYDFANEWNNHAYGAVRVDGSIWSLSCVANVINDATSVLASVYKGECEISAYAALTRINEAELLWVNRQAGLVDTHEFRLLETFICNYLPETSVCLPLLREVPYGYDAMVTMRLDCDESIKSALPLFELYKSKNIPFSLAIKTAQQADEADFQLLDDVISHGGAILSHTVNHKNNWGVNKEDARSEARESRQWILDHVSNTETLEYAVSPFHQNPDYAVEALALEGYQGFIGGIICNDPQYLVSRGGELYGVDNIITHSQQCMLHGDCLLKAANDQLAVYKKSAELCIRSGALFGYLDHPFSERYQYGWVSEAQRVGVHRDWLDYLQTMGRVLFENEVNALSFIKSKSGINLCMDSGVVKFESRYTLPDYDPAYEYRGEIRRLL